MDHLRIMMVENIKSDSEISESQKYKLTLGIDKEIIKKAKAAGINISAITEQLLTAMTFEPKEGGTTFYDVVKAYEVFIEEIRKISSEYNIEIVVGAMRGIGGDREKPRYLSLNIYGGIMCYEDAQEEKDPSHNLGACLEFGYIYRPTKILENLLTALIRGAEHNKEKIKELKVALRVIKSLASNNGENGNGKIF